MTTDTIARGLAVGVKAELTSRFRMHRQLSIVAGLDSLTAGAGGNNYRQYLKPLLTARFGDPGTPGWVPIDNTPLTDIFGATPLSLTNMSYTTGLAWTDPIRQKALFGLGIYHATASASGSWSITFSDSRLPGASTQVLGVRLMVMLRSSDATFRWRSGSLESGAAGTIVSVAGGYAQDKVIVVERRYDSTMGASPAVIVDNVAGDITFLGLEPITALPGVKLINLGLGGQKMTDWSLMDETTAIAIARFLRPDLLIFEGGMNDRTTVSATPFGYAAETVLGWWQQGSKNCLVIRSNDSSDAASTNLKNYTPILAGIAQSRGCGFLDVRDLVGDYAAANTAGYMLSDGTGVHLNAAGFQIKANGLYARILNYANTPAYRP